MSTLASRVQAELIKRADYVGSGIGFKSDYFDLLALILAFYKALGTEPEQMLGDPLRQKIDYILECLSAADG